MRRLLRFLHHRSLSTSIAALVLSLLPIGLLPESAYRLKHQAGAYLAQAGLTVFFGLLFSALTLVILIRDNRSGYPSFRCSLATLLWAFACVPVVYLGAVVIRTLL